MKMKKIFAAMAATAISASAFAAMSLSASAADTVAVAGLRGQAGTYTYWGASDNSGNVTVSDANVDGNAQYEATWELTGDGTGSIEFLILQLVAPDGSDFKFTTDTFPQVQIKVDDIQVDGQSISFTQTDAAYNTAYYERDDNSGSRAYLVANWGVNGGNDLGVSKEQAITSKVKVLFTVSGLDNDGTSNVTTDEPATDAPTDAPTEAPTEAPKDDAKTTTEAKKDDAKATTTKAADAAKTTAKAAANSSSEKSAQTGDNGVGLALAVVAAAGAAAFVARKKD